MMHDSIAELHNTIDKQKGLDAGIKFVYQHGLDRSSWSPEVLVATISGQTEPWVDGFNEAVAFMTLILKHGKEINVPS